MSNRMLGNAKRIKDARRPRNPLRVKYHKKPRALRNRSKYPKAS